METRKTKVLAFCLGSIPSALLGVVYPLENLSSRGYIDFKFLETAAVTRADIAEADVIVCIRSSEYVEYRIVKECKRLGKFIVYFLDDDLLNIPESANSYEYFNKKFIRKTICDIVGLSHILWTTNRNIAVRYMSLLENHAVIHAPALFEKQTAPVKTHECTTIGFAGGIDHQKFIDQLLEEPVRRIVEAYGDKVRFEFFGVKPSFFDEKTMTYISYVDSYEAYKQTIISRRWDIALAPLHYSAFHSCKYFNKYLEYGSINVAAIFSNVEPFTFIVRDGVNGLLAENTGDCFTACISRLIDNSELRQELARNAKKDLEENFSLDAIGDSIRKQIPQFLTHQAPACVEHEVKVLKHGSSRLIFKLENIIRREGIHVFGFVIKKVFLKLNGKFRPEK